MGRMFSPLLSSVMPARCQFGNGPKTDREAVANEAVV